MTVSHSFFLPEIAPGAARTCDSCDAPAEQLTFVHTDDSSHARHHCAHHHHWGETPAP